MTGLKLLRITAGSALALALLAPTAALADRRSESEAAFQRGFDRLEKGDVRTARIEAMKALQANPSNPLARILNARVMLEIGNGVAAQTEIEKAVAAGFPRDKTRHLLAHALILQNQLPRALKEADPANIPDQFASYAARIRGRAQVAQQQPERARAEFELAARLAPNSADALIDLARFRMINQDSGGGVAEVDRALQIEPTNIKGLLLKGDMVRASQGLEKSLPLFNQALQVDPNNIEALLERAGTYGDLRREKEARADLQKVLGLIPDHPLALYLSAVLESRAGRYAQAQALMTRTKGVLNTYAPALMLQGMLAYQTGNMQQADEFLAKVVAQVPGSSLARKLYAAVQLRKGDAEGALATLKPVIDAGKPDARTLALVGSAHARLGNYADAQRFLEQASAGAPTETSLKTQLAMTRIAQGDDAGASAMLQQVLRSDKNSLQALMTLTLVNLRSSKFREALAASNQIVTAYPQLPIGFNMRGAAMLGLGDIKAAEANFRTAIAKKPDFAEARRNLAQLLAATNRVPAARKELLTILETNRNDVRAMAALAEISRQSGQTAERINWLRQAAAIDPKGVQPRIALAQAYVQSGQTEKALTEVSALERDFPQNAAVVELAGVTQLASRRTAQAESAFNRLVTLAPNQVGPRILLARTQALQNRPAEARATYQQALTLTGQNLVPVYVDMIALEARNNNMPGALALVQRLRTAYPKLNVADQVTGDIQLNAGNL
ncbi:MAG: PEP-CTERM system TPR-repeat protein PrsT, partial [Alphaproteobacteria bacterium]|nr:PEP-CTERM system TPR-repeat protein PrsT [Alphaproteobacteria bacterium]